MSKLKVMDFFADWCGPCKQFGPIFESVAAENSEVEFQKINVDSDSEASMKYGIRSIPTIIFEKDGEILMRKTGSLSKTELTRIVSELK
jgi:thioredoxin 1